MFQALLGALLFCVVRHFRRVIDEYMVWGIRDSIVVINNATLIAAGAVRDVR